MTHPPTTISDTLAVHAGVHADPATGAIMTPICTRPRPSSRLTSTSNWLMTTRRAGNPTHRAGGIGSAEGGRFGLSFRPGAATDTVLRPVRPGERVLCGIDLYGGTFACSTRCWPITASSLIM